MNTTETKLRELVFKLVAKKLTDNGASDLARRVVNMTTGINHPYAVKIGDAEFFADGDLSFFFQYKFINIGTFDEEGNYAADNDAFLCNSDDLVRLLQELTEE